jgi:hypothetical protein
MTLPEENFDNDIWAVLKKIKERSLYADSNIDIPYSIADLSDKNDGLPPADDEIVILKYLHKNGAIKLKNVDSVDLLRPDFYIDITQPGFDLLYGLHNVFTETRQNSNNKTDEDDLMELHFDNSGDFWRKPKNIYCYKMRKNETRYKIIRLLIDNNGYQQTSKISSLLGGKNEQQIRTEIAKIRKAIHQKLKITGGKIIEGREGSGYRINPKYRIVME